MPRIALLLLPLCLAWPSFGRAIEVFHVNDVDGKLTPAQRAQFESDLMHAYSFVTVIVADHADRANCPIQVRFKDFKGQRVGFTPKSETSCNDEVDLDQKLLGDWTAQIVFAHELTHVIRHQSNPNEELWLDEGLAKFVEVEFGGLWPDKLQDQLGTLKEFHLSPDAADYGASGAGYVTGFFLVQYLFNRFGEKKLIQNLIQGRLGGWENIESALASLSTEAAIKIPNQFLNRDSIWTHFAFALFTNDPDFADYGLFLLDYAFRVPGRNSTLFASPQQKTAMPWTIRYRNAASPAGMLATDNTYLGCIGKNGQLTEVKTLAPGSISPCTDPSATPTTLDIWTDHKN